MAYELEVKRSAAKGLRRVPRDILEQSIAVIDTLASEPRPHGCIQLVGHENLYRVRIGDWRIIYEVDDPESLVTILAVKHRREIYRDF